MSSSSPKNKRKGSPNKGDSLKKSDTKRGSLNSQGSTGSLNSTQRSLSGSPSNYSLKNYKPPTYSTFMDDESKKKEKHKEFDINSVRTEAEINRAIAQQTKKKNDASENRDFPGANMAQENIDKLQKKSDELKLNNIEKAHHDRLEQLAQLRNQERENLDEAWKDNFRKHEDSAQRLRVELAHAQKNGRLEVENIAPEPFHPSREYLDVDRKMQALKQNSNFQGAQVLLKDLKAMEKTERGQWDVKEQGRAGLRLSQFDEKAAKERADLEARIEDDRIVMVQTQTRSYEELEGKFQALFQIEDTTYNNDKQKLQKKLI